MQIQQFDVKTAFLHGDLTEEIYMKQPEGFITNPSLVCRLHKSLYGLKQSPRCWNIKFTAFLKSFNFKQLETDKCVFQTKIEGELVFLALYVDDGLVMCKKSEIIDKILTECNKQFEIIVMDSNCFVGLEFKHNLKEKQLFVSQYNYITRMLKRFNMLFEHVQHINLLTKARRIEYKKLVLRAGYLNQNGPFEYYRSLCEV